MKHVTIHTDGGCKGNPGPGGYGVVLVCGRHRKELSAGFRRTTNNRMELLAAIAAFECLTEPCRIDIHSDSRYLVDAIQKRWVEAWASRGWRRADKSPVKNPDLWQRLIVAMRPHQVRWHWLKGHAGHAENERCDQLAEAAVRAGGLLEDDGMRD